MNTQGMFIWSGLLAGDWYFQLWLLWPGRSL